MAKNIVCVDEMSIQKNNGPPLKAQTHRTRFHNGRDFSIFTDR
jgi:hypothetical protein